MRNYIAAHAAKAIIATVISAACLGSGAVACFATAIAPATTSAAAVTANKIVPKDTSPWP